MEQLTPAEFAAKINGRSYPLSLTNGEVAEAQASGLVIVFGYSDDNMEFVGCIDDEISAYNGTTARISKTGALMRSWEDVDKDDEDQAQEYFRHKLAGFKEIEAVWSPDDEPGYSWVFRTDIPHATFEIVDDGEPYCRGIVFNLGDVI